MKFLEFMGGGGFRENEKGDTLYFPWGSFGSGYILDTPARKKKIIYVSSGMSVAVIAILIAVYNKFGWAETWLLLPPYWLCHMFATSWMTRGLMKSTEKVTFRQNLAEQANKRGFGFLILMLILSFCMMGIAIWTIAIGTNKLPGLFVLVGSLLGICLWAVLIFKKHRTTPPLKSYAQLGTAERCFDQFRSAAIVGKNNIFEQKRGYP